MASLQALGTWVEYRGQSPSRAAAPVQEKAVDTKSDTDDNRVMIRSRKTTGR